MTITICLMLLGLLGGSSLGVPAGSSLRPPAGESHPDAFLRDDSLRPGAAESIAEVRLDADGDGTPDRIGDTVTVAGLVTAGRGRLTLPQTDVAALQDRTAGIHVLLPSGPPVERGDILRVRGIVGHKNGLTRLQAVATQVFSTPSSEPDPLPLSVASADGERYEGRLVRVRGHIAVKNRNEGGKYLVLESQSEDSAAQITVYVADRHLDRIRLGRFEEGDEIRVTGVLGQFNYSYQVEPRDPVDLASLSAGTSYLWTALFVLGGGAVGATGIWILLKSAVRRRTHQLKESRRELRAQEEQLRGLANSIPGVIFQFFARPDGTTGIHFVSEHAESLLGISADPSTFLDRFLEQVPVSHREEVRASVREAVEQQTSWRVEIPFEKPSGERIWLLGTSTPEEREEGLVFNGVILDITERKEAEEAVREERNRFETLFETLPTPVACGIQLEEGIIVSDVNAAFEEVFACSQGEAEGQNLDDLIVPEGHKKGAVQLNDQLLAQDGTVQAEVRRQARDGLRTFQLRVTNRPDGEGPPEGYGIYTDITEQKQRERALKETNATLEAILENLPVGVLTEDASREIITANRTFCDVLGLEISPDAITGHDFGAVAEDVSEQFSDPEAFRARTQAAIEEGESFFGEELRLADGRVVERDFVCYEVPDGKAALWLYRDVTEREQRRQTLERQNDLFMKAQDLANVGAWEYNVRTEKLTWTEQVYRIYGLSLQAEVTAEKAIDFYHPDDRPKVREVFSKAVEEGTSYDEELRILTTDGENRWVRTRGEPQWDGDDPEVEGHEGDAVRVRGTIQDITDRKNWERSLRDRQEKLGGLYEVTNQLLRVDSEDELSARLATLVDEVLDYPATTIRLAKGDELVPAHVPPVVQEHMPERPAYDIDGDVPAAEAYRTGETRAFEDLSTAMESMERGDIRATAYVPMGTYGLISIGSVEVGGIGTFDLRLLEVLASYAALVFGHLEREEALREAKDEAEEASRMQSAFLANMSHEIRTPLTSIIGFAEALGTESSELDLPEGSALPEYANLIEQGGKRLLDTLEGVLNLSKLEAGQMELGKSPVNLADEVQRTVEELRSKARKKQIDLQLQTEHVQAEADEGGVQIVMRNLLSNAIKYTEKEGTVWLRTYQEEGRAVLEVEDTGIGMAPSLAEDLFEPFRQASEGFGREYEGTGVGLAVTKQATEQMDGHLEFETEEDAGSRFIVQLPVVENLDESEDENAANGKRKDV